MKTLSAILLCLSLLNLQAQQLPNSPTTVSPPEIVTSEPEEVLGWILVGAAVVVCATAVYVCAKSASKAEEKHRCDECTRILPQNTLVCPICGHRNNAQAKQAASQEEIVPASMRPDFETVIQMNTGEEWEDVYLMPQHMSGPSLLSTLDLIVFNDDTLAAQWIAENTHSVLATIPKPQAPCVRFRLAERDLP